MAGKNKFMMLKDLKLADKLSPVFTEILAERIRQIGKFGEQNHPMIGEFESWFPSKESLESTLNGCRKRMRENICWFDVLLEEFLEVFIEESPEKQREEMIQTAAVAVAIIEYLDRKIEGGKK